jgi:hypothetical protein
MLVNVNISEALETATSKHSQYSFEKALVDTPPTYTKFQIDDAVRDW